MKQLKQQTEVYPKLVIDINMDKEIKKPTLTEPKYFDEAYDYRNIETAGKYRGVGERGKVGLKSSDSIDAMPAEKKTIRVPRDHKG